VVYAQGGKDSVLKTYHLGEVAITGFKIEELAIPQVTTIDFKELRTSDATDLSQIERFVPSGRIRTNSRGESLMFLRGAGERHLGYFFDGVPMNLPWDGRFDISIVPLDAVGEISVSQNASSILYGPNVLGGALNLNSYERAIDGSNGSISISGSDAGTYTAGGTYDYRKGNFNFIAAGSWLDSKGLTLPGGAPSDLKNQDLSAKYITNSDKKRISLFTRGEWHISDNAKTGLSVNFYAGSKAVIPETDQKPSKTRYWRYPDQQRIIISSNSKFRLSGKQDLTAVLWFDNYGQQIDSYTDLTYSKINEVEKDLDRTFGGRLSSTYSIDEANAITGVFNFSTSNHNEKLSDKNGVQTSDLDFSESLLSAGVEYSFKKDAFSLLAGALYDMDIKGKTGAFTEYENTKSSSPGAFASLSYTLSNNWEVYGGFTYRNRFASLREGFSGALGKMKPNPDLKPEKGTLTDVGFIYNAAGVRVKLSGFYNLYSDLMVQITLPASEDPLKRKMRVNLADARIVGFETVYDFQLSRHFNLHGNFMYLSAKGKNDGETEDVIENKPEILSLIAFEAKPIKELSILVESELTGKQIEYDADVPGGKVEIAGSAVFNARISWLFASPTWTAEVYFRANNIFDQYRVFESGVTMPGRFLTGGVSFRL